MPKKVNVHPGVQVLADGKVVARFFHDGGEFSKTHESSEEAIAWKVQLKKDLEKCVPGVNYKRNSWWASIVFEGLPIEEKFDSVDEANSWLLTTQATIKAGVFSPNAALEKTVASVVVDWKASKVRATERTMERYQSSLRTHVLPKFGHRKISSLTQAEIRDWVKKLSEGGSSPDAIGRAAKVLKQVLRFAAEEGYIVASPVKRLELPAVLSPEKRHLTIKELDLLAKATGRYSVLIKFLGLTGLRIGEALALNVSDIDYKRGVVKVSKALTYDGSYKVVIGPTKTKANREVHIPTVLLPELRVYSGSRTPRQPLFVGPKGGRLTYGTLSRNFFRPAVASLGLTGVTIHSLRHTCASLYIANNTNIVTVSRILGHSNVTVTLNTYSHLYLSDLVESAAALSVSVESELGLAA
jgi:integrase